MYAYFLKAFIDGRFTPVGLFKQQSDFNTNLLAQLGRILSGHVFRIIVCADGVIVESATPLDTFARSSFTIFVNSVELEFRVSDKPLVY